MKPEDPSIRRRIIEQLAATVNGCLAELGYFPGTVQKLQQLELENKDLAEKNRKLYHDNLTLIGWLDNAYVNYAP